MYASILFAVIFLLNHCVGLLNDFKPPVQVDQQRRREVPAWDSFQVKYRLREAQARSALREMRFWESLSPEDQLYFHMPIKGFKSEQQLERDRIPDSKVPIDESEDEAQSSPEEDYEMEESDESDFDEDTETLYIPEEEASKNYDLFA